jgi:hypothetical protein
MYNPVTEETGCGGYYEKGLELMQRLVIYV